MPPSLSHLAVAVIPTKRDIWLTAASPEEVNGQRKHHILWTIAEDKWRNLLKASGLIGQGNHKGDGKRNLAWRPLPKSIIRRVCELAAMYPYPKGQKQKVPMITKYIQHTSPGTDITFNDYRRILRSIDGD